MRVPTEILDRYAAGERDIRVAPSVFAEYGDGLMAMYHRTATVRQDTEAWLAYKAARVICDEKFLCAECGEQVAYYPARVRCVRCTLKAAARALAARCKGSAQ